MRPERGSVRLTPAAVLVLAIAACSGHGTPGSTLGDSGAPATDVGAVADAGTGMGDGAADGADGPPVADALVTSDSPAAADATIVSGDSSGPDGAGPTSKAEELVTHPGRSLVLQATADHTLAPSERALVALYMAFLADGYQKGQYNPILLKSGIQEAVVALAARYPSFFSVDGAGTHLLFVELGQTAFTCADSCAPSAAALKATGSTAFTVISGAILGPGSQASTQLGTLINTATAALSGASLEVALGQLASANSDQILAAIQSIATALVGGAATLTSIAAAPEEAAALVAVATIYSGTLMAVQIGQLLVAVDACQNFKRLNCSCSQGTTLCNNQCVHDTCLPNQVFSPTSCRCDCRSGLVQCGGNCVANTCLPGQAFDVASCRCKCPDASPSYFCGQCIPRAPMGASCCNSTICLPPLSCQANAQKQVACR